MTKSLRIASLLTLMLGAAVTSTGCIIGECENGEDNCFTLEPGTIWLGQERVSTLEYQDGADIVLRNQNGNVTFVQGTEADKLTLTIKPFTIRAGDDEATAQKDMNDDLLVETSDDGKISISLKRTDGANGFLGAHLEVALPLDFNGGLDLTVDSGALDADFSKTSPTATKVAVDGDIAFVGAAGKLDFDIDGFNCAIQVASWSADDGNVKADCSKGLAFTVAADQSGALQVTSSQGAVNEPDPLPGSWTASDDNTDTAKSYSFGGSAAEFGTVKISNSGDVTLAQE